MNLLFGLRVGYYNGNVIHRTRLIQAVPIRTNSFAYQAEALVKMLRAHCSYVEVPYASRTYDGLFSNAMKPKNLIAVVQCLLRTFVDVRLRGLVPAIPADGRTRSPGLPQPPHEPATANLERPAGKPGT